jgi:hypothetical protein
MSTIDCKQLQKELDDAAMLRSALDAAIKDAATTGDAAKVRELMEAFQKKREAIEDLLDTRHLGLRQRLAKKMGAEYVADFHDGLAVMHRPQHKDGKFIYVDKNGDTVIDGNFDGAQGFSEGRAIVYRNGTAYVIGVDGNFVNPEGFGTGRASDYYRGFSFFSDSRGFTSLYDKGGQKVSLFGNDLRDRPKMEGHGVVKISESGGSVIAPLRLYFKENKDGTAEVHEIKKAYDVSDGMAHLVFSDNTHHFTDESGNDIVPEGFDDAHDFSDGVAWVSRGEKAFFIDTTGKNVSGKEFDTHGSTFNDFHDGLANIVHAPGGLHTIIDKSGEEVMKQELKCHFSEGAAVARKWESNTRYYIVIDRAGKQISRKITEFTGLTIFHPKKNGRFRVGDSNGGCFIDDQGTIIGGYRSAKDFEGDYAAVQDPSRAWRFVGKDGTQIGSERYAAVADTSPIPGLRQVKRLTYPDQWVFVDKKGEVKSTHGYDAIRRRSDGVIVGLEGMPQKYFLIGSDGRELHEKAFGNIGDFMGEVAIAVVYDGSHQQGQRVVINRKGEVLCENIVVKEQIVSDGVMGVHAMSDSGTVPVYFDEKGKRVFNKKK